MRRKLLEYDVRKKNAVTLFNPYGGPEPELRGEMRTKPAPQGYSTGEVVRMSGATPRQLQWWDEHGIIVPKGRVHKGGRGNWRAYTREQVIATGIVLELRRKGLGLGPIRRAVRAARGMETGYLVMGASSRACVTWALDDAAAVRLAAGTPTAVFVVSITGLAARIL